MNQYVHFLCVICVSIIVTAVFLWIQLFLEEERERELERLYESGLADTLNREDAPIGSGAVDDTNPDANPGDTTAQVESTIVTKQTTETLMAGERIVEALDLADAERATWAEYEEAKKSLSSEEEKAKVPPPPRNAILAAYDLEPEAWVLKVVSGVQATALLDALLVLPFDKVVSLMGYLNIWARRVRISFSLPILRSISYILISRCLMCDRSGTSLWFLGSCSSFSKPIITRSSLIEP